MIIIHTDGAYNPALNQGGWAAIIAGNGEDSRLSGKASQTTNNRMEMTAALEALRHTPVGSEVIIYTDSQYLYGSMTKNWQRRANKDLWEQLDEAVSQRQVEWKWLADGDENYFHKLSHNLATGLSNQVDTPPDSPHMLPVTATGQSETPERQAQEAALESAPAPVLRLIDANLNRAGEGLRLLEELARMVLNDTELTRQLKTIRHKLLRSDAEFQEQLLRARAADEDVGADLQAESREERELPLVLVANARRAQESLRALEEIAKMPGVARQLDSNMFKQSRFALYTIEQKLMAKLRRQDRQKLISGVGIVIDTEYLKAPSLTEVGRQVIREGARIICLQSQTANKARALALASQLKDICTEAKVLFVIGEQLDIALGVNADGLQINRDNLPVTVIRRLLPPDKILGYSAKSPEEAVQAQSDGADYILAGPVFSGVPALQEEAIGLETLRQIKQSVTTPVLAFGGITGENLADVIKTGIDAIMLTGDTGMLESPEKIVRQMVEIMENNK